MNVLAHIFLSGENDLIKIGNFIGDSVKGHDYDKYQTDIRKGILTHRSIDSYTDDHPVVRRSKQLMYPDYNRYSGIIIDIVYDHYLSLAWTKYSNIPLRKYIDSIYEILLKNLDKLPPNTHDFCRRFVSNDWISYYSSIEGIGYILDRFSSFTNMPINLSGATSVLTEHFDAFSKDFDEFFPQLMTHISQKHDIIYTKP